MCRVSGIIVAAASWTQAEVVMALLTFAVFLLTLAVWWYAKRTLRATQTSLDFFTTPYVELDWEGPFRAGRGPTVFATLRNSSALAVWVGWDQVKLDVVALEPPGAGDWFIATPVEDLVVVDDKIVGQSGLDRYRVPGYLRIPVVFDRTSAEPEPSDTDREIKVKASINVTYEYRGKPGDVDGSFVFSMRLRKSQRNTWVLEPPQQPHKPHPP